MTVELGRDNDGAIPHPRGRRPAAASAADPVSQSEVVIRGIKEMITSGQLNPGSRLPIEKDLAVELSVSRGSLREGVRALVAMGVLETRQGDGTYVTSLEPAKLLISMGFMIDLQSRTNTGHLQSVRRVLEAEAVALAAVRINDTELTEAANCLTEMEALTFSDGELDYEAVLEADISFHRIIAHASGNPGLEAFIEALASRTLRARLWRAIHDQSGLQDTLAEHRAILGELESHQADRARIRMANHLLSVEEFMDANPSDDPTTAGAQ